jgi:hypothetical protein
MNVTLYLETPDASIEIISGDVVPDDARKAAAALSLMRNDTVTANKVD